jgi:protein SCO1/2
VRSWAGGALALTLALALAGCGGSSAPAHTSTTSQARATEASAPSFDGPTLANVQAAPPLALHDYLGHPVNLADYRGKAVLLTFLYTHCPDVCPLITASLHNALLLLGRQDAKVQVIAVSTDPKGDTPTAVHAFLARHDMLGRMEYLTGTRAQLRPVWRAWGITASNPTVNDQVNHSALVYGISGGGQVMVVYPANFKPSAVAHDVPLLAGQ